MTNPRSYGRATAGVIGLLVASLIVGVGYMPAFAADVSDANAFEKSATAETAADHEALATYFRGKAQAAGKDAELHEKMLTAAQGAAGGRNYSAMLPHCQGLIRASREAQKSYQDLAELHADLAKKAGAK